MVYMGRTVRQKNVVFSFSHHVAPITQQLCRTKRLEGYGGALAVQISTSCGGLRCYKAKVNDQSGDASVNTYRC